MEYRRACEEDFPQIFALQNKNLLSALGEEGRKDGFLSTAFTLEQLHAMHESLGVIVADDDGKVAGYICGSTAELNQQFQRPAAMLKSCKSLVFEEHPLTSYNFFVANPICIDQLYRGTGVYQKLCNKVLEIAADEYDLAVGFIAERNTRHLSAVQKIQANFVGEFEVEGEKFIIVVAPTN